MPHKESIYMKRKEIELLAPAGNMEALKAAVSAGCNAVYLGGTLLDEIIVNAQQRANLRSGGR